MHALTVLNTSAATPLPKQWRTLGLPPGLGAALGTLCALGAPLGQLLLGSLSLCRFCIRGTGKPQGSRPAGKALKATLCGAAVVPKSG